MSTESKYKLDSGKELACMQVMRSLPGKRLVFAGEYEGSKVVAKLYLDSKKAEKHWRRELDGIEVFMQCNVATADLLYAGKTEPEGYPVIVLAQLVGLQSVKQAWEAADNQVRDQLLRRMVMLLACHHQAGLCQEDMHLGNFMLSDDEIYSLDGAGVKFYQNGVGKEASLDNLALYLAQLAPEWESRVADMYNLYATARDWQHGPGHESLLYRVREAREGRWKEFRSKLFRSCTAYTYTEYGNGFQVVANRYANSELSKLLQAPDSSFPGTECALKNGNTCTVWAATVGGLELVIKRYNIKNIWHGLKLRLLSGRGERSWLNGYRMIFYGVPTPNPVALLKRRSGLFPTAYLLTERVQAVSAREWFQNQNISMEDKNGMADQIARILQILQQQRIVHGDLKASNILIADEKPMVIDLDAMRRIKSGSRFSSAWAQDIRRFLQNWETDDELLGMFIKALKSHGIDAVDAI